MKDGAAGPRAALGDLPGWDLRDLYPAAESPELESDLKQAESAAADFAEAYAGRLADLDGDALAEAIARYETVYETLSRVMSFASLMHAGNVTDTEISRFFQTMQERVNGISATLLFFVLEINRIEDARMEAQLESPALARYRPWLRDTRAAREFQLSDEIEKLLHEKQVAGRTAWMRLFDQTLAELRFPFKDRMLTETEILHLLSDPDAASRKEAAQSFGSVLGDNIKVFALVTNTLAKEKEIEDRWRGFARPISARNLTNFVEDDVVDALIGSVREAYPRLSHRYYKLKAAWFGAETIDYWDRNAPFPDEDDRVIPWREARETVLDAYGAFSGELAGIGRRFFENDWIDAAVRPGKASGAFSHPTVPSAHPYLLLNYQGRTRDVMTLAHELGHGVHQILSGQQGHLMANTPLTLAETASVFGEMLTFRSMLAATGDTKARRVMLAGKIEDMLNTVVRQVAFCEFERRVHDERRAAELTPDRLGKIWMEIQRESLGPALTLHDEYRHFWAYIPHFIHTPFYVYAYAFGDCLVNSLYSVYQGAESGFAEKYLEMLSAGGTKRHRELLEPFGLDASDPKFWSRGLSVIEGFIGEFEAAL